MLQYLILQDISNIQHLLVGAGIVVGTSNENLASILYKYDESHVGVSHVSAYWVISRDFRFNHSVTTTNLTAKIPTSLIII